MHYYYHSYRFSPYWIMIGSLLCVVGQGFRSEKSMATQQKPNKNGDTYHKIWP